MINKLFLLILLFFFFSFAKICQNDISVDVKFVDSTTAIVNASCYYNDEYKEYIPANTIIAHLRSAAESNIQFFLISEKKYVGYINYIQKIKGYSEPSSKRSGISVTYKLKKNLTPLESSLNHRGKEKKSIRIGVLKRDENLSQLIGKTWIGADIIFARKIGYFLQREIELVGFDEKSNCFLALENKEIDLAIASIRLNDGRSSKIIVSDPYFETGAVISSANFKTVDLCSQEGFNINIVRSFTFTGSPGYDQLKCLTKKYVYDFVSWPRLLEEVILIEKEHGKNNGFTATIVFIDEIRTLSSPCLFLIEHKGKRCYTWERYVVAGKNRNFIKLVNQVIKLGEIPILYRNLAGRDERK